MKLTDNQLIIAAAVAVFTFLIWDARRGTSTPNGDDVMIAPANVSAQPTDAAAGAGAVLQEVAQSVAVVSTSAIPVMP